MRVAVTLALASTLVAAAIGAATAAPPDPKPPSGRDPGGIAVALIGAGLDYRRPEIAGRLARDGEGEPVAWDFADNDARPYAPGGGDEALAAVVLGDGPSTRLAVFRTAPGRQDQIAAALRLTADTPARIALVVADPGAPIDRANLVQAARHLAGLLIIVPAKLVTSRVGQASSEPSNAATGLLVVAAEGAAEPADVAVPVPAAAGPDSDRLAAAHVAAVAARLLATEPSLDGAGLRSRIVGLSEPAAAGPPVISRIGASDGWNSGILPGKQP